MTAVSPTSAFGPTSCGNAAATRSRRTKSSCARSSRSRSRALLAASAFPGQRHRSQAPQYSWPWRTNCATGSDRTAIAPVKKSWLIDALRRRPNPNIRATKCKVAQRCWGSLFVAITPGWVARLLAWSALLATAVVAALLLEAFAASALVAQGTAAPSDVCATPSPVTAVLADG